MNDDLISRKMAIDAIIDHIREKFAQRDTPLNYISGLYKAEDIIEILPSAEPNLQPTCNQLATNYAQSIVKCETCYYWGNRIMMRDGSLGDCGNFGVSLSKDFFCAWWSQKEKGDEQDE